MPASLIRLLVFMILLGVLVAVVQIGLVQITFEKLGLSERSAFLLLFSSLIGSNINMPLFTVRAEAAPPPMDPNLMAFLRRAGLIVPGRTVIAVNVGGCVIPVAFCVYLIAHFPLHAFQTILGTAVVAAVSFAFSRPIGKLGIGMPALIAPVTAALTASALATENAAALAYVSGVLGVLVGADMLHMADIRRTGAYVASIGGAGTFDGIFLTGMLAVLLT
jgi:uncharacterized membrane protein